MDIIGYETHCKAKCESSTVIYQDIVNFLVIPMSNLTLKQMKATKNLEVWFISGWGKKKTLVEKLYREYSEYSQISNYKYNRLEERLIIIHHILLYSVYCFIILM